MKKNFFLHFAFFSSLIYIDMCGKRVFTIYPVLGGAY